MTPANSNGSFLQKYSNNVLAFHQAMALPIGDLNAPAFLNDEEANLRARLTNEEVGETINKGIIADNAIELIDGIGDTLYVALGTGVSVGFDPAPFVPWNEPRVVHDPKLLFSRSHYFKEMLIGACRAACAAIDARDVHACRATTIGLIYVLNAMVNAWNIPLEPFWDEIHRANMQKWPPDVDSSGRRLGKVRKPPGWRGPDHVPIFNEVFGLSRAI